MDRRVKSTSVDERGLTLIELLVVLAIIAMAAGVVALNMPPPRVKAFAQGEKLAAKLEALSAESIMRGAVLGLDVDASGMRIYQFERGGWSAAELPGVTDMKFETGLSVSIDVEDASLNNEPEIEVTRDGEFRPDIMLGPTGEATPMAITFAERDGRATVRMSSFGEVSLDRNAPK